MSMFCKKQFKSKYELQREANIRRNEKLLLKLGIDIRSKGNSRHSPLSEDSPDCCSDQEWEPNACEDGKGQREKRPVDKKPTLQQAKYRPGLVEELIRQDEREEREQRKRKKPLASTHSNGKRRKTVSSPLKDITMRCDYTFGKCAIRRKAVDDFESLKMVDLSLEEEREGCERTGGGLCYEEFLQREEEVAEMEEDIALVGRHIRQQELQQRLQMQDRDTDTPAPPAREQSLAKDRNRRHMKHVDYTEEDLSDEDCSLLCEECNEVFMGACPVHGELLPLDESQMNVSPLSIIPIPSGLCLRRSAIPGAGLGIFAAERIPVRTRMGPYAGRLVKGQLDDFPNESEYLWQIKRDHGKTIWYVDGEDLSKANWLRFVNCARDEAEQNLVSFQYRGRIYYRSYKAILPGEELLVYYGDQYARQLGVLPVGGEKRCENVESGVEVVTTTHSEVIRSRLAKSKPFQCEQCSCSYSNKKNLIAHTRLHTEDNPFKCQYCSKQSVSKTNLLEHIRTHTGEKPFECSTCHKRFSQRINLTIHIRTHTGEKPFECSTCQKRFSRSSHLTRHLRTHTGEKPYEHTIYKKAFADLRSKRKHMDTHDQ